MPPSRGRPRVPYAVASFLEFAAGAVLVAHNAPYDTGFLRGACARFDLAWPRPMVVDTARVARAALLPDEVPNHKLATLARLAGSGTVPCHRALADARATVDVLHYLIGRVGDIGVHTVEELAQLTVRVSAAQRRKRSLADGLPNRPGVYQFLDRQGRPLYIGTSRTRPRPGAQLLHRQREALPDGRDGGSGGLGHRDRVLDGAGGRRSGVAAAGRAQAPLQPALPVPGASDLGQTHRRALPEAVHRRPGAGPMPARRPTSGRCPTGARPSAWSRRCSWRSRSVRAPSGWLPGPAAPPAWPPSSATASPRATGRSRARRTWC